MELVILLGFLVIIAALRREVRAMRTRRRRRSQLAARTHRLPAGVPAPAIVVATLMAVVALAGCNKAGATKPDLPASTLIQPRIVYVTRNVYVPIRADLTQREPIAEGPLAQCPVVAADRKAALQRANAKLTQIGAIQGTEAMP